MDKLKDIANNSVKLTEEEYLNLQLNKMNNEVGNLKGYNCEECKNKGWLYYIKKDSYFNSSTIVAKPCKCKIIRTNLYNLKQCGISEYLLEKYKFANFKTNEEWQTKFKSKVMKFFDNYISTKDKSNWLVVSGSTGCGKTHLCTALFQDLIMQGLSGKYLLWKDDVKKLKQLSKSSYTSNIDKFQEILEEIKNVDVLYIDDFFKLIDKNNLEEDLNIAYEIINARYMQPHKITIISTEYNKSQIMEFDSAIGGRIVERAKNNYIQLTPSDDRNYRLKE